MSDDNEIIKEDILESLDVIDEETFERILLKMIDDSDIELKTEIKNPLAITQLAILAESLNDSDFKITGKLINSVKKHYLVAMISYKRQSRKEIVESLKSRLIEAEARFSDKMMGKV